MFEIQLYDKLNVHVRKTAQKVVMFYHKCVSGAPPTSFTFFRLSTARIRDRTKQERTGKVKEQS